MTAEIFSLVMSIGALAIAPWKGAITNRFLADGSAQHGMKLSLRVLAIEITTVIALSLLLFFYGLGNFGLAGADEPRYAQIAREMLRNNDFVTPTLHGSPWLEKPALYYWRAAAASRTFGVTTGPPDFPPLHSHWRWSSSSTFTCAGFAPVRNSGRR